MRPGTVLHRGRHERPRARTPAPAPDPGTRRLTELLLAVAIFLGSLILWLGIPLGWLWLAARLSDKSLTFYAFALVGCPSTMALWGLLLGRLNSAYVRISRGNPQQQNAAWLQSLAGEPLPRRPPNVLDASMTISVIVATLAISIWFLVYAADHGPMLAY